MERLSFAVEAARTLRDPRLERVTVAPLTEPLAAGADAQAAVFRLAPGGRIARHPATVPQLLAVLEGSGRVSGADGEAIELGPGDAVFWAAGEEHETVTDGGLTALVLEAPGLRPYGPRPGGPAPE
jgi:quercetin dioxygenase-like cupin family protein